MLSRTVAVGTPAQSRILDSSLSENSHEVNGWNNRILVDEVDILHAVEQGARLANRTECRLSHLHGGMAYSRLSHHSLFSLLRKLNLQRNNV